VTFYGYALLTGFLLVVAPMVVYLSFKLGRAGWLRGQQVFQDWKDRKQQERKEDEEFWGTKS
jgi:hypothetical protein